MIARHFDVVVLGTRLGALAAAALLARRDFRVLVLGQGSRPSTYRYDGLPLRRRTFAHLAAPSPAWRRVVAELAQSQAFKRRLRPLDPMLQVIDGKRRLELPPDPQLFARELDRELPVARPSIEELYAQLARINARIDEVLERDAVWPPGTFWERRETGRLRDMLPALGGEGASSRARGERIEELPIDAGYRPIVEISARFASHSAMGHGYMVPLLPLARMHGAWARGTSELAGDEDELVQMLVERIRAHGGDVRPNDRCEAILHKRGRVHAITLEGEDVPTSCTFVVGDRPASKLVDLVRDLELSDSVRFPGSTVARRRFVISLVVRRALVPEPLAHHAFLVPHRPLNDGGVEVHLQRATFATPPQPLVDLDAELWVAEALVDEGALTPRGDPRGREAVMQTLRDHFPYLDRHALVVDSPHDGVPIWDLRDGTRRGIDRSAIRATGGAVEPETADAQYQREADAYAGLGGEPIRTPVQHLLSVSPAVLPALGVEGELVAAWGAARLVTRTDRKREKMRREMWSKIEI
jgi:phytoene dehydrogenase-like protein